MKTLKISSSSHCLSASRTTGLPLVWRGIFVMDEIWKDIPEYKGYYQASTLGNVKSLDRIVFMGPVGNVLKKGTILKQRVSKNSPYYRTRIGINNKHETVLVHRLIASAFHENTENKKTVNHIDGNKLNNKPDNLEWATYSENSNHAIRTGLRVIPFGEKSHSAKLTESQVIEIKSILATNQYTHVQIAEMFGVKKSAIGYINVGINWKHLNNTQ